MTNLKEKRMFLFMLSITILALELMLRCLWIFMTVEVLIDMCMSFSFDN